MILYYLMAEFPLDERGLIFFTIVLSVFGVIGLAVYLFDVFTKNHDQE